MKPLTLDAADLHVLSFETADVLFDTRSCRVTADPRKTNPCICP